MSDTLVDKLLSSFDELERCISVTREVLAEKQGVPSGVMERIEQYSDIVSKQKGLALELQGHITEQNWDEVSRHVKLINGLSTMIRDDAQAILTGAFKAPSPEKRETFLC